jgi:hypothetical protein
VRILVPLLVVAAAAGAGVALAAGGHGASTRPAAAQARRAHAWPALPTASDFLVLELRRKAEGRWGEVWQQLYPTHRQVVTRESYVRCERATPVPTTVESLRVVSVRRAPVRVAGLAHTVPGVALRTEEKLTWFGPRDPILLMHTFHLVPVRGRWTWLLSPQRYRLYRTDGCGVVPAV